MALASDGSRHHTRIPATHRRQSLASRFSDSPIRLLAILAAALLAASPVAAQTYNISTFAGGALPVNVPGTNASLFGPQSAITVDPVGNVFFVDGNTVLRLDAVSGALSLVAGNGTAGYSGDNGPATSAQLHSPCGIALDSAGNLYISSFYDSVVREVSGGTITTVVGTGVSGFSGDNGPAIAAQLNNPYGLAFDSAGNLYIADYGNNRVREVSGGTITTVAGNGLAGFSGDSGSAIDASVSAPKGVAVDAAGNLYIADTGNNRIREVSGAVISTFAGNGYQGFGGDSGPASAAQLNSPCGIAFDSAGNLYIADYYNNRIRKVSAGIITTVAGKGTAGFSGDGGLATKAQLNSPFVVAVDFSGNVYFADYGNHRIREVSAAGIVNTVAGNGTSGFSGDGGPATNAQLHAPAGIVFDSTGNAYIADSQNNRVRKVSAGVVTTVAGTGIAGFSGDGNSAVNAELNQPTGVALDATGNLYIADSGNNRVRKISSGAITTVAGNGTAGFAGDSAAATSAELSQPTGVALDPSGNLYIADLANNRIRKVTTGTIATVAGTGTPGVTGDGGPALAAQLNQPASVALDSTGNLYIADSGNNRIRKISNGTIATVAGNGTAGLTGDNAAATSAEINAPLGVMIGAGGIIYIADTANNVVRKVSGSGTIVTIAGGGAIFGDNGPATSAELAGPQAIGLDSAGNIYIADTLDNRIRLLTPFPLSITGPTSLPVGVIGVPYPGATLVASGGTGTYAWSATGVPKGLTFSTAGSLTGTPTAAATSSLQFTLKDSGGATATTTLSLTVTQPFPTISSFTPTSAMVYGAAFTLTVNGTGYLAGATIQWNGVSLPTKVVSATQLTASVSAAQIASPGTATITVTSGGNASAPVTFAINTPTPSLTSMSPASVTATTAGFTMTLTGTGFLSTSQVQWNGSPLVTTFVSATQLTASVPATLIATSGPASIVVSTGQLSSSALTFTIGAPPAIAGLSPTSAAAYSAAFTLTITGTGFASGATVDWNNSPLTTKFVSATQLTASVPASMIGGAGNVTILATSGGATSNSFTFTITPPPPVITTLIPNSAVATGPAFTLTVNGNSFASTDTVQWAGSALPTTFVSPNQLTAYVASSLIAGAGTASVTVSSPTATSTASTFTITAAPAISALTPASAIAGGPTFTLTVNGTGFVSGAQIQWNGAALPTTFVSIGQLTAAIPSNLIASMGSVTIQVNSGGASSTGMTLPINGPPTIAAMNPVSAAVGGAAFTLTVSGTGFIATSAITWNGTAIATKFVSATQLTASVTATLIASAATVAVAVTTGSASTGSLTFSVTAPPAISALNPGTVIGSGAPFTLTVSGTGFVSGTTIEWNGTALTTTFVSATQVTASVPANMAVGSGTANIVAANSTGQSSVAVKLPITAAIPAITTGGVVPIYSSATVIQPGSWISIYGTGLANGTYLWSGNFPTTLGGTTVTIDGKAAYLWSVSPTQINLQAPNDTTTGSVKVIVTTSAGSASSTVTLAAYGPSFSLLTASNYAAAEILTPSGTGAYGGGTYDLAGPSGFFTFNTRPVKAGEILELFGVGFGPTTPAVSAGKAFTGTAPTANSVTVTIGGVTAKVLFSGMTEAGVYQLNVVVPGVASGDQPLLATAGGVSTPANVLIAVQ